MKYTPLNNFQYNIVGTKVILKKYIGKEKIVNIPNKYEIDKNIKRVILSDFGYETIGVFERTNIEKVILPNTITVIPCRCFALCHQLHKIILSKYTTTIKKMAFLNCPFEEIDLPESILEIENEAFSNCYALKTIQLPSNIKKIHDCCFENCTQLKYIKIPFDIENIENPFVNCHKLKLEDFENKYIKIKNNNIYRKEIKNNKVNYRLTNCYQKNDTLIINKNETCYWLENDNVKNIILDNNQSLELFYIATKSKTLQTLILPNIKELNLNIITDYQEIKHLYITDQCKEHAYNFDQIFVENLYYNGTKEEFDEIKNKYDYWNIIYKKNINELLKDGYNFKQIDLIKKAYNKNILLSNVNPQIDHLILRNIVNNFNYTSPILYEILDLIQKKELNFDIELKIQNLIKNKTEI